MAQDDHPTYIPLGSCEICSQLKDMESSFYKYAWEDMDRPLPAAASRLVLAEDIAGYDQEHHHVKRCPICGTFYQYDFTYEYLVNGSEDEETLTRLTPDQAKKYLSDDQYTFLMEELARSLREADPITQAYAARCLQENQ